MGTFLNAIPRANLPYAVESSHLLSPRESGQRGQLWKYLRDTTSRTNHLTNGLSVTQRALERLARRNQSLSNFHPFKIYQPSTYWPNSNSAYVATLAGNGPTPSILWRTFRVRNGLVCTTNVLGLDIEGTGQSGVKGTDLVDTPYDETWVYKKDQVTYITKCPEYVANDNTSAFVFWVEIYSVDGVDYAVLRYGADPDDPPETDYTDPDGINPSWHSTNPWTSYPAPDSSHFIIGFVDTFTLNQQAIVRQLQVQDILSSGGGGVPCPFG